MKRWSKFIAAFAAAASTLVVSRAQQQPVVSVAIEQINVGGTVTSTNPLTFSGGTTFTVPNESSGPAGTPINIAAFATGTSLVSSFTYSWFVNGVPIGVTTSPVLPPNRAVDRWTPPQPGSYFLTVTATDNTNTATSLPIRYFATGTVINSPLTNTLVPDGSSVVIKADATVASGFIKQIQFYDSINGGAATPIGVDTTIPYSLIYTPPGGSGSTHSITAQATDNNGNTVPISAPITLNVVTPITPLPTVAITSPANGAIMGVPPTGNSIPIQVSAVSTTGRIAKVELYIDGVLFGTNTTFPYTFSWSPAVVGKYNLVALGYDDKNNVVGSQTNTVNIAAPPNVAITTPSNGGTVTGGSPVRITAVASSSNNGATIQTVQFFVDTVFVGEDSQPVSGVYSVQATFTQKVDANGAPIPSVITAIATDSAGISGVSPTVSVNVTVGGGGAPPPVVGQPPTVSLTAPVAGTTITVNTPVGLTANASDSDGFVTSVQFLVGTTSISTTTKYPYTATWTPTALGTYTLGAKATDNDGNATSSQTIQVTVVDPTPNAPTVAVSAPASGSTVLVGTAQTLKATASDAGSIAGVQFFVNGQPQGTVVTSFPFTTAWNPTTPGSYTITARATNASGVQATAAPVIVTVSGGTPPTVTLTTPTNSTTLGVNAPQTLTATATSATGTIANVQFYVNGVLIGTATKFPYSTPWTPTSAGTYTILARATDNLGNSTDSTAATVTVAGGAAPTVSITNPAPNSTYTVTTPLTLNATAGDTDGTVASVQFFVNGVAVGAASTAAPYGAAWTPNAAGTYSLTAQATDNSGNVTTSAPVVVTITGNGAPTVSIINPATGTSASAGTAVTLTASAADADGTVARVRFFANGTVVGTPATTAPFTTAWTPSAAGTYNLVAEATDNSGNVTNSAPIVVTVITNQPPTVAVTAPSNGYATTAGLPTVLTASANDSDGTVSRVRFIVNGTVVGNPITTAPFSTTWTPTSAGTYSVVAEATDNIGNVATSQPITVNVAGNTAPTVSVTTPANGSTVRVGSGATVEVSAKDTDGTVASVQIYVNGSALGAPLTTFPYRTSWTPAAEGVYRISATATDNGGASSTSSPITVLAVSALSAASDRVFTGPFNGIGDTGKFALIVSGKTATFIGYSTVAPAKVYYFPDLTVDAAGGFSGTDASGRAISGNANDTGATITVDNRILLIGVATSSAVAAPVPPGHYSGSLGGVPGSMIDAIVASDGSIALYLANGNSTDAVAGTLTSAGTASLTSAITGIKYSISIDPATGFLTGSISGTNAGTLAGALASGSAFSDGSLRNLSTRGQVGTGANILIAGFVVAGDTPKQVLIRAIGPTLSTFGVSGAISDPQLQLYKVSTLIASNDNWENNADIANASAQVGAFPLSATSRDSAILAKLAPGSYTAQVSGVAGATGVALVELYDVDNVAPFSAQKVMNVSTRGVVGTGQSQLIAGFVVSGNIAKKVLIRAVGPSLATVGVTSGLLADPMLRLSRSVNGTDTLVRENDNWSQGNDPAAVVDASTRVGAFPLNAGSKDAAILITLAPGVYTAQATGASNSTGVALIEVYEVP